MSGTSGKAERSERDDGMSTGVAIPSQQPAYDAPTISRVMREQRGDGHLETSTSHRDRYGTSPLPPTARRRGWSACCPGGGNSAGTPAQTRRSRRITLQTG